MFLRSCVAQGLSRGDGPCHSLLYPASIMKIRLVNLAKNQPSKSLRYSNTISFSGHYDPYQAVATSSNYSGLCNRYNPFACEVGDLSNKQVSGVLTKKKNEAAVNKLDVSTT